MFFNFFSSVFFTVLSIIYMIVISDSLLQYQCCYYSYPCLFIVLLFPIFIIIFIAINIAVILLLLMQWCY